MHQPRAGDAGYSGSDPRDRRPRLAKEEDPLASRKKGKTKRRRRSRSFRWFLRGALGIAVVLLLFGGWQWATWPDVAGLARGEDPGGSAFIQAYRARMRAEGKDDTIRRVWVPGDAISPHLKRAVLVAEDINFFSHSGFALDEIESALTRAIQVGRAPRGASTITQQLVKNLWLSPSRSPWRKLKEAILTVQAERVLGKRRILELYLNLVELGPGIYGAEAAARRYFGESAADLDEREAAMLAASLPRPSSWHPGSSSRGYARAVERILDRMGKAQFLWRQIDAGG
ncbi:MAG: monofunctional biosynthetic peptidoglycan transglycosylase [Acidobacteriota bacterium]|jgi:monofunctional biosynthetic peptidoglycan transglycosylase